MLTCSPGPKQALQGLLYLMATTVESRGMRYPPASKTETNTGHKHHLHSQTRGIIGECCQAHAFATSRCALVVLMHMNYVWMLHVSPPPVPLRKSAAVMLEAAYRHVLSNLLLYWPDCPCRPGSASANKRHTKQQAILALSTVASVILLDGQQSRLRVDIYTPGSC